MQIFVAHDFIRPPLRQYRRPFEQAAEKYKVNFVFADQYRVAEHLLQQIESLIEQSDFCFFDVSKWNRNVMFELGFARGREKDHCLLFRPLRGFLTRMGFTEGFADLPSDLKGLKYIEYHNERSLKYQLFEEVARLTGQGADLSRTEDLLAARVENVISSQAEGMRMQEIAERLRIDAELARASVRKLLREERVITTGNGPHRRYLKTKQSGPVQAAE
jgi:hypothetical protein